MARVCRFVLVALLLVPAAACRGEAPPPSPPAISAAPTPPVQPPSTVLQLPRRQGITYFISGGAGSLRRGDLRRNALVAGGFDQDYHFMLIEISGDELFYQAISRTGTSIDYGVIKRKE